MAYYVLSEDDRQSINELLHERRTKRNPQRTPAPVETSQSPEVYIARTPTSGIPVLAEETGTGYNDHPGSANCTIYQLLGASDGTVYLESTELVKTVYNLTGSLVSGSSWILIVRDKFGKWVAVRSAGDALPDATPLVRGAVSTGTQSFGGDKTFENSPNSTRIVGGGLYVGLGLPPFTEYTLIDSNGIAFSDPPVSIVPLDRTATSQYFGVTGVSGDFDGYAVSFNAGGTWLYGVTGTDPVGNVVSGGIITTLGAATVGNALTSNPLSQFAATTSAQLAGVISDETGSGALVFANSPVFTTPNIGSATGNITGNAGGNAATATALQTARNISGVSFNGTANIDIISGTTPPGDPVNIAGWLAVSVGGVTRKIPYYA